MIDFKTLPNNEINGFIQYHFKAENGYGASIVKHRFSYGYDIELWELAVIGKDGSITNDVLGYLSEQEVNEILEKISKFTA